MILANKKVCKFGGTSMADADSIKDVEDIVKSDPTRVFIVVSAPGKRFKDDEKITDLLYKAYDTKSDCKAFSAVFGKIKARYDEIIKDLGVALDLKDIYAEIEREIKASDAPYYSASRGEYLSALILAKYLNFNFLDTKEIIKFDGEKNFDSEKTNVLAAKALSKLENAVIPGFYGSDEKNRIVTFSRGGSDVTGSIIARAANACVYENWTDVDGFLTADPRIVKNPRLIDVLSYKELRELSYMGASVLHHEAIFPVKKAGIPINVKNTFDKTKVGTFIRPAAQIEHGDRVITGIAGKKGYSVINIEKSLLNNEIGFVRKVLSVLEKYNISFEHMPTGIDTLSIVLADSEFKIPSQKLLQEISNAVTPDIIGVSTGLSLIAVVGHGMAHKTGTATKIFTALSDENVNIKMIDQGSSELNIIVAVDTVDYEKAINAIYKSFIGRE
ncbi:MAG: aspartate kinase [Clostridiales bacterium]|jgi:aspartate kinase|nr:aspartate kinase [Clostridiales bacterium]